MQDEVEKRLWEQAWRVFGDSLAVVLSETLAGYKRSAGFDEMQRLYPSTIGAEALQVLRQALTRQWLQATLADHNRLSNCAPVSESI